MKFTLEIELGNEAMRHTGHVANALKDTAENICLATGKTGRIYDQNSNTVGKWEVTDDQPANVTLAGTKRLS